MAFAPIASFGFGGAYGRPVYSGYSSPYPTYGAPAGRSLSSTVRYSSGGAYQYGYPQYPSYTPNPLSTPGSTYTPAPLIASQAVTRYAQPQAVAKPAAVVATNGHASTAGAMFDGVEEAPPDPILSLALLFKEDTFAQKVNLGIGAYRTEQGKPWPLPSVKAAEAVVLNDPQFDKEYIPIDGLPALKPLTQALIFGQDSIQAKRIASSQALSGTGSLRIAGTFLKDFLKSSVIYVSDPTWGNHNAIFKKAGLDVKTYTYYHPPTRGFDFAGMMADLQKMPPKSGILLHACAHNPTGVDPTEEQWNEIISVIQARKLYPVVDNAYQGYASGDLDADNLATQLLERAGLEFFVCQSFAKNFGLYGERIGMVHAMCTSAERAKAVLSQIKMIIRPMYSSPPRHGAEVVLTVLGDPGLCQMWKDELKLMSNRILEMRSLLRGKLEELGTPGTWNHITDQIGMFSYTGLTKPQCERLQDEFHIYLLKSGRISLAGINENNCDYLANCIDIVVREN